MKYLDFVDTAIFFETTKKNAAVNRRVSLLFLQKLI